MMDQYWSWLLSGVGVTGLYLAGNKIWWSWWVNVAGQGLWFTYAIATEQWGFFLAGFAYGFVFIRNGIKSTREYRAEKLKSESRSADVRIVDVRFIFDSSKFDGPMNEFWMQLKKTAKQQEAKLEIKDD